MNIRNKKGSALYIVLIFSIVTFAVASVYFLGQYNLTTSSYKSRIKLQALLNARSGIWYGLTLIQEQKENADAISDTSMGTLFGEDMLDHEIEEDTSEYELILESGGAPMDIYPFDSAMYGGSTLLLHSSVNFRILESVGFFRNINSKAIATIGSKPFTSPDTVLFLSTPGGPNGPGRVDGYITFITYSIDNTDSLERKRFNVDMEELRNIVNEYKEPLTAMSDSGILSPPLTIQYNDEFPEIPDKVYGPLFIDGSRHDLFWKAKRTIYVLEELQITEDVLIENVSFIVKGDIKILDNAELRSVDLFSLSRIFFAGESIYSGNAMACADIEIYEDARIVDKSIIISTGFSRRTIKDTSQTQESTKEKSPIPKKRKKAFSMFVRDQAVVDGILIDLSRLQGISTDMETIISGILWSRARISHRGRMEGIIKASVLVNPEEPLKVTENYLEGSITELETIEKYHIPYFIGEPVIIDWKEE